MVLTTVKEKDAAAAAKKLIARSRKEATAAESRVIVEMVATIIW